MGCHSTGFNPVLTDTYEKADLSHQKWSMDLREWPLPARSGQLARRVRWPTYLFSPRDLLACSAKSVNCAPFSS